MMAHGLNGGTAQRPLLSFRRMLNPFCIPNATVKTPFELEF